MNLLDNEDIDKLLITIEESTRSTKQGVKYFLEPARGTLSRVTSKRHHLVFGRRGSGKSSLLEKAVTELTTSRRPIAKVDLEGFKGHQYPDVLISVLIRTFNEFERWLNTAAISPRNKWSLWRIFGRKPDSPPLNKRLAAASALQLRVASNDLEKLLHADDDVKTEVEVCAEDSTLTREKDSIEINAEVVAVELGSENTASTRDKRRVKQESVKTKVSQLHRNILRYQDIFRGIAELSDGDSFLLLDDLYHIRRSDQPSVLDFFHRIAKGNGLWIKAGTIKHRTDWYTHGDPPIGMKIGDDADIVDLDLTLDQYDQAKKFLLNILQRFCDDAGVDVKAILADGARDRLVLASGGVARDFLSIFRKSVEVARERGGGSRGEKVGIEDVNIASGAHDTSKQEEFKRDTLGDQSLLQEEYRRVNEFCVRKKANCFLVDIKNEEPDRVAFLDELVDLKLLHLVRSRVTVGGDEKYTGRTFKAYMLDLSQYTGTRKLRDLQIIEFWKTASANQLRRSSIIYLSPVLTGMSNRNLGAKGEKDEF